MSSDDEQEDNDGGIFDQLKSIKPFTIDQLYLLHPDVSLPPSSSSANVSDSEQGLGSYHDRELFQNLVEFEQLRIKLAELRGQVKKLHKKTFDHVDKVWILKDESLRRIGMCQQGKIAETTFKYKQAFLNPKQLDTFTLSFRELADIINKEYIYYSFESQMKRHKITTQLSIAYQIEELEEREAKLKVSIATLIDFLKYLGDTKSEFVIQCRKWFRGLAMRFLAPRETTENYLFIVAQLSRGPAGIADWSADLIECKPFDRVNSHFENVPQYISHCSALLSELFNCLKIRIKLIESLNPKDSNTDDDGEEVEELGPRGNNGNSKTLTKITATTATISNNDQDQNWSLIDPRFSCSEELNISSASGNLLSESDVIKFCLRIPVAQIFRAYVKKCLDSNEFQLETDKNYEYIMLKLLTIGTIIIKTYQIGLETFNSIQYGNLIEYLSSQIRRTVIVLSDQWTEFKRRLRGVDDALLMRLQVEYDNFILRSILIILELRQSGIWRLLSRVEPNYEGLTENELTTQSWSAETLRPAFMKLLQVTGLSPQVSLEDSTSQQAAQSSPSSPQGKTPPTTNTSHPQQQQQHNQQVQSKRTSHNHTSLTYEFSVEWFREVSEPMLWHILWQFYHNAFTSSCDYHSDNYWLQKFHEKSVTYLFVNKIRDSPPGECSYLLNSITSMVLSRTRQDSRLVNFIATEVFDLSFKHESTKNKMAKKGIRSLIRSAEKFPNLISVYLSYMNSDMVLEENIVELIKGCSLNGWLCNDEETSLITHWLIETPITSVRNRVARLILSKLLLNTPEVRPEKQSSGSNDGNMSSSSSVILNQNQMSPRNSVSKGPNVRSLTRRANLQRDCFVDLKLRRKIALAIYEACKHHQPENSEISPTSLGASVEVAFGSLYCTMNPGSESNLMDLSTESTYQQFYVWSWRILFTLRLHILNQNETDWNDVQSRSGTSRSIKNTTLLDDSFHPVPSIQDSECFSLAEGIKSEVPMASFIYLLMTDVTWQSDTVDLCLDHLNIMAKSGHLSPSLMAMEYFTICHLNDLVDRVARDVKCQNYFTAIIVSNFDSTRLASLIMSQLEHLKQYRQLQLSQFYTKVLIEVSAQIDKQVSASWFSGNEYCLEKIACLLDYIVRFNFSTQRADIIRKFYDCSFSIQETAATGSWFGSLFVTNSLNANSTRREFLTTLHVLTQKYKKYTWLRWLTTECDALRLEKIWEDIVDYLSYNEDANLDAAIKKVCPHVNASILKSILPINSWIKQIHDIMESDLSHPLCPLIWYNFFLNYFANSLNGVSVGLKLVPVEMVDKLKSRLDSLINYHLFKQRSWGTTGGGDGGRSSNNIQQQNSLTRLYKAYRLWLLDSSLRDAYVDVGRLKEDYLVPLLKSVLESSIEDACLQYIDIQSIENQNKNLIQVWSTATRLNGNHLLKDMFFVQSNQDDSMEILTSLSDEASDAVSLIAKSSYATSGQQSNQRNLDSTPAPEQNRLLANAEEELKKPLDEYNLSNGNSSTTYRSLEEMIQTIHNNFHIVFDESSMFGANLIELDKTKDEIVDLAENLYANKRREIVRIVRCVEGDACIGPARIKFEIEEATIDEKRNQCILNRRRQCEEVIMSMLIMPTQKVVKSTVSIEEHVKQLVDDPGRAKKVIESLLKWISEPKAYDQMNGPYHPANYLLKTILELMSASEHINTYNTKLVDICIEHPGSVQIFSPFMSPSSCSSECFLDLYKKISSNQQTLGPIAMFVMLSKFDVNHWLKSIKNNKQMHHELIKTTCFALKCMGKDLDESYVLTFELYKRHLYLELAAPDRRKPEEIALVFSEFLRYMDQQSLDPSLWLDFLNIIGLERNVTTRNQQQQSDTISMNRSIASMPQKSRNSDRDSDSASVLTQTPNLDYEHSQSLDSSEIYSDLQRLADNQMILDYHSLTEMMQMLDQFVQSKRGSVDVTLIEYYNDYLDKFSLVLMSLTFMWLKSIGDQYPDNLPLVWQQFIGIWYDWVFLTKNCQNVGKTSYNLMANNFVHTLKYMIQKLPENRQKILQFTLSTLTQYVTKTKEVIYLELTILQRCLKKLPWSSLQASPDDYDNLAALSEQENYNMSDLVSFVLSQLNIRDSLAVIHERLRAESTGDNEDSIYQVLSHVAERLATIIILQSSHLKGFRLFGGYFTLIPIDHVTRLSSLISSRMEYVNLEHSQTNKLLVNLLRLMCIKIDLTNNGIGGGAKGQNESTNNIIGSNSADDMERSLIYAQFVSNYLIDLIKNHPTVIQHHQAYLRAVIDNSLQDLKNLLSPNVDMSQKTLIYTNLLECCNCESLNQESRLHIIKCFIASEIIKSRPIVVMELFHAIGKIIRDGTILVYAIERLIALYLKLNGHYDKVLKSFSLKVLPSDLYLGACFEDNAPLALLVYFESLYRNGLDDSQTSSQLATEGEKFQVVNNNKIWSSFFHWISRLSIVQSATSPIAANDADIVDLSIEAKISIAWLRLIDMLEVNLQLLVLNSESRPKSANSDTKSETESLSSQPSGTGTTSLSTRQRKSTAAATVASAKLISSHKSLVDFIKRLMSIYDSSNTGGLWSYLKYSRSYETSRISLIALAVACFLSDRTLICSNLVASQGKSEVLSDDQVASSAAIGSLATLRDEVGKCRRSCLVKLESARRAKHYSEYVQFIEALIESVNQNEKVQYSEGVQLITTFVKGAFSPKSPATVAAFPAFPPTTFTPTGQQTVATDARQQQQVSAAVDGSIDIICIEKILPTYK